MLNRKQIHRSAVQHPVYKILNRMVVPDELQCLGTNQDRALKRQGLDNLLAYRKPICAAKRLGLWLLPLYPVHTEGAARNPTKPTARGQECFRVQMERNVNTHPPQRYFLPASCHTADNLPMPPTDHCWQQCNPFVAKGLPREHRGGNEERQGPRHRGPGCTKCRRQRGREGGGGRKGAGTNTHTKKKGEGVGGGGGGRGKRRAPRPRAPRAGKHKKPGRAGRESGGGMKEEGTNTEPKKKAKKKQKHGQPQPGGG